MSDKAGASSAAAVGSKSGKEAPWYRVWGRAIDSCDSGMVMRLLQKDPSRLPQTGSKGRTALHVLVLDGRTDLVEDVLRMCPGKGSASSSSPHQEDTAAAAFSVQDLVEAVDGSCGETAFGYALLVGDRKVAITLIRAYLGKEYSEITEDGTTERDERDATERGLLRSIIKGLPSILQNKFPHTEDHINILNAVVEGIRERNEGEEYALHHLCYGSYLKTIRIEESMRKCIDEVMDVIVEEVKNAESGRSLTDFLFKLHDRRGNTPLHAALRGELYFIVKPQNGEGSTSAQKKIQQRLKEERIYMLEKVLRLIPEECVNIRDSAGRTALHIAATMGDHRKLVEMIVNDERTLLNTPFTPFTETISNDLSVNFDIAWRALMPNYTKVNPHDLFGRLTALHLAVLEDNVYAVKLFLNTKHSRIDVNSIASGCVSVGSGKEKMYVDWTALQMAVLKGNTKVVQMLLEDDRAYDMGRIKNITRVSCGWPALHLAARSGNREIVRMILDNRKFDPMVRFKRSSALHQAVEVTTIDRNFQCVVYFVNLNNCLKRAYEKKTYIQKEATHDEYSEKKGCINLLIRAGLDVWSKDSNGYTPNPGLLASKEDRDWWYEKVDNVAKEAKSNLTAATNAISVTSALIATTSFVGPLQPPLGYQNGVSIEYELLSVRFFIVCNCLSFYFAVASIVMSMIPSLPLPHESSQIQFKRIRKTVIVAMCFLITSLIFVLVSFAAANVAVLPSQWKYKILTFSTSILGGGVCLGVLCLFVFRLVTLIFYKHQYVRDLYNVLAKV